MKNMLSEITYRNWFRRFKGNDFDVNDKERSGQPKKFEDGDITGRRFMSDAQKVVENTKYR